MSFNAIFGWHRDYTPARCADGRIDLAQSSFEAEVFARELPFQRIDLPRAMENEIEKLGILADVRNMPGEIEIYRACGKHTAFINPAAVDPLAFDAQGRLGGLCPDCDG